MAIKIDHDLPVPEPENGRDAGRPSKYPFDQMKVRDSFLFPEGTKRDTAYKNMYYWAKKLGYQFIIRQIAGRLRCWRVK